MPEQRIFEKIKSFVESSLNNVRTKIIAIAKLRKVEVSETATIKECISALTNAMKKVAVKVDDATATAADVLYGKKGYSKEGEIIGTIPLKTAATYTPGTSDQTIAAGVYLSGAQTIKGDSNLTAGNIKSGVSIFGVTGTCEAQTYYECTAVSGDTWSGKKYILDAIGNYTVSDTVTTGLTCSGFTPVVGGIYNANTTILVKSIQSIDYGIVFYAPLSAASSTAETGQTLTTDGSITYQTFKGIPCAYFNGSGTRIYSSTFSTISGSQPSTMSFWVYVTGKGGKNNEANIFGFGQWDNGRYVWSAKDNLVSISGYCWGDRNGTGYETPAYNTWYHVAFVVNPPNLYLYINGVLVSEATNNSINTVSDGYPVVMGGNEQGASDRNLIGYLAGCRIYDRVLSQGEITALANEFTPTTE